MVSLRQYELTIIPVPPLPIEGESSVKGEISVGAPFISLPDVAGMAARAYKWRPYRNFALLPEDYNPDGACEVVFS